MRIMTAMMTLMLGAGVLSADIVAQSHGGEDQALASQRRGIEVIRRGIEAHGGLERMNSVRTVRLEARVSNRALGQSPRPGAEAASSSGSAIYFHQVRDLKSGRRIYEIFPSDTASQPGQRVAYGPDVFQILTLATDAVQNVDRASGEAFLQQLPYLPEILTGALKRAGTVRLIGEHGAGADRTQMVTFATASGVQHTLSFDARTGRLAKSSFVTTHAQFGDHVQEFDYGSYQTMAGLTLPMKVESRTAGRLAAEVEFESIEFGVPFDETLLEFPEAAEGPSFGATSITPANLEVTTLGDGVYMIPGVAAGYTVMFVELDESVMVLEAPISPEISRATMAKIRETVPGKPIRYALMTHYHFDHSGGIRAYAEDGVTILASPGNRNFIREIANAPRTLEGVWTSSIQSPAVEAVRGKRVVGRGAARVELYEVGPNPHVDEILIAYLPSLKLMFVADIYSFTGTVTPANPWTLSLADRLEELDLDIDIVVPVHGQQTTGENFWEAVRMGREAGN